MILIIIHRLQDLQTVFQQQNLRLIKAFFLVKGF